MVQSAADPADGALAERLITVATRLFAERGYDRTSVQDVVEAAGVTKGALYHYFASKTDLLYEIYTRVLRMQTDRLATFAGAEGPVQARLRDATVDVITTTIDNLDAATVFYQTLPQLSEPKRRAVRRERRRYHEMFRSMIEEGQRAGEFRADISADLAVDFIFGAVHHLPRWYSPSGTQGPDDIARTFADLFLQGIRSGSAR